MNSVLFCLFFLQAKDLVYKGQEVFTLLFLSFLTQSQSLIVHPLALQPRPLHSYSCCLFRSSNVWCAHINTIAGSSNSQIQEALLFLPHLFSRLPLCLVSLNPSFLGQGEVCPFVSVQLGDANGKRGEAKTISQTHNTSRQALADPKRTVWATGNTHTRIAYTLKCTYTMRDNRECLVLDM